MMGFLTSEWVLLWGTPLTALLILVELGVSKLRHQRYYTRKDTVHNLFLAVCNALCDAASKTAGFLLLRRVYTHRIALPFFPQPAWAYWLSLLLLEDLVYWLMHFTDHKVRLLWAGHVHHHSSREFNFTVGLRSAVFEPVEKFVFFLPLALLGYRPVDILLIYVLTQGWGTFLHTRAVKRLGILEVFLTTPSHHRVHHGRNAKYLDKNFGMVLIVWDKLFGTYQAEDPAEAVEFGTVCDVPYKNCADLIFHEFSEIGNDLRQPLSLKERLLYVFGPPGYSHDGCRKTARQLRQEGLPSAARRKPARRKAAHEQAV